MYKFQRHMWNGIVCSLFQSNVYRPGPTLNDKKGKIKYKIQNNWKGYYISELKLQESRRDNYSYYFGTIRMDLKKVPSMGSDTG